MARGCCCYPAAAAGVLHPQRLKEQLYANPCTCRALGYHMRLLPACYCTIPEQQWGNDCACALKMPVTLGAGQINHHTSSHLTMRLKCPELAYCFPLSSLMCAVAIQVAEADPGYAAHPCLFGDMEIETTGTASIIIQSLAFLFPLLEITSIPKSSTSCTGPRTNPIPGLPTMEAVLLRLEAVHGAGGAAELRVVHRQDVQPQALLRGVLQDPGAEALDVRGVVPGLRHHALLHTQRETDITSLPATQG